MSVVEQGMVVGQRQRAGERREVSEQRFLALSARVLVRKAFVRKSVSVKPSARIPDLRYAQGT